MAKCMKESIIEEVNSNQYFCTTVDLWSAYGKSYLGMTLHFLNISLERKSYAIACERFTGVHNYKSICDKLLKIQNYYGLNEKNITVSVTDSGSNFKKCFREFGSSYTFEAADIAQNEAGVQCVNENENSENEDEGDTDFENIDYIFSTENEIMLLPFHHSCAAHTLSLIATADIKKFCAINKIFGKSYHGATAKCFGLWNLLNRSANKAKEACIEIIGKTLKRPCITRWNSLFDCLENILAVDKTKLDKLFQKLNLPRILDNQYDFLKEFTEVIKPLAVTLDILQGDITVTMADLIPSILNLHFKFNKMCTSSASPRSDACTDLLKFLMQSLKARFPYVWSFNEQSYHYVLATMSHPKWKLKWAPPENREELRQIFLKEIKSSSVAIENKNNDELLTNPPSKYDFTDFIESSENEENSDVDNSSEIMMMRYLTESATDLGVLDKFPIIKDIYRKYNSGIQWN